MFSRQTFLAFAHCGSWFVLFFATTKAFSLLTGPVNAKLLPFVHILFTLGKRQFGITSNLGMPRSLTPLMLAGPIMHQVRCLLSD